MDDTTKQRLLFEELCDVEVFRCGWCGTPTDADGFPLSIDVCNSISDARMDNATLVVGECCVDERMLEECGYCYDSIGNMVNVDGEIIG